MQHLPPGFGLALDPEVARPRREVLVGGSPLRVLRLTKAGAATVDRWVAGEPVGTAAREQALARRLLDAGIVHPRALACAHPGIGDVAVVIPVRDDPVGLAATLGALGPDALVVDDGSSPPALAKNFIRRDRPGGPAAARNTGWRATAAEIVAFVDAGCEPSPGWLETLLPHFADPSVAAVAPRITTITDVATPPALARYERRRSPLDLGPRESPVRPRARVPYVPSAALLVRRSALEGAGGFDEGLRYGEDVDLVWRLGKSGWRVRYEPAATVGHPARRSWLSWLGQRHSYGLSAAPLAARHGRDVAPLSVQPWSAAAWGLAVSGHPVAAAAIVLGTSSAVAMRARDDRATAGALFRLALSGNLRAGSALAAAVRRAWLLPALLLLGRRRFLVAALAVAPLHLADDLAYQSGVWVGVVRARSAAALLPRW